MPSSRSAPPPLLWNTAMVLLMVVLPAVAVLLAFPESSADQLQARSAGRELLGKLNALRPGDTVDFAAAAGVPWDRAVFFEPYMSGGEMNEALGFDWYGDDDVSASDESQQKLVLVADRAVVVDLTFGLDDGVTFDEAIDDFDPSIATFIARTRASGELVLSRAE